MAITFLPPDLYQSPCGVTVGIVAEASDIERIAESFRGVVDVFPSSESGSTVGYDMVFRQSENPQEVEVLLPYGDDPSRVHRILVSVAGGPFPALDSVAYVVLAPAFATGGVGIDWEDVCMILRSGMRAVLAMGKSCLAAYNSVMPIAAALTVRSYPGILAAWFVPLGATLDWTREVPKLGLVGETIAPYGLRLASAPFILSGSPVCSLLVVVAE